MATRSLSLSRLKHIGSVSSKLHHQLGTIRNMVGAIDEERERLTTLMLEVERTGITECAEIFSRIKRKCSGLGIR